MTDTAPRESRSVPHRFSARAVLPMLLVLIGPLVYATPLVAVASLLVLCTGAGIVAWSARALSGRALLPDLAVFAPLLAWMLASAAWSLDAPAAVSLALRLGIVLSAGIALVHWVRILPLDRLGPCLTALAAGFTLASVLVMVDLLLLHGAFARLLHRTHGEHYDFALVYGRGATLYAILAVPLLLGLWRSGARRFAIAQAVLGLAAVLVTSSLSAKLALATALLVGGGVFLLPPLRYGLLAVLTLGAASLPVILPYHPDAEVACWMSNHKSSALHRLYIWNFTTERIAERPIAGWGLDAARRIPGGDAPVVIYGCDTQGQPTDLRHVDSTVMPLHPHDAFLQIWLELGGIGIVLGFGAVLLVLIRAVQAPEWHSRRAQAGIAGAVAAGSSVALISFGIWQEWFLAGLSIAAAITVLAARQDERAS